jgi:hypothetical protein
VGYGVNTTTETVMGGSVSATPSAVRLRVTSEERMETRSGCSMEFSESPLGPFTYAQLASGHTQYLRVSNEINEMVCVLRASFARAPLRSPNALGDNPNER